MLIYARGAADRCGRWSTTCSMAWPHLTGRPTTRPGRRLDSAIRAAIMSRLHSRE
ncbi:MAG: hypothetical protein MZW92_00665 [Comamonadaceae bacterium]|nr:hypothetical protein [Comamonadaceae bacterium]